jgi:class 3 adenylate cyclase
MNLRRLPRFALLLGLSAGALFAADAKTASRVTVVFANPEKFTDIRDNSSDYDNERGRERYLPVIEEYLQQLGESRLAPGQKLTITFTDIDLAGDFEPWRGPQFNDVRIIKEIYIPRMTFSFKLTDANGQVVKEGERKLQDLSFQMRIDGFRDDPLRYEKSMLGDWLREEFRPAVAKN